MKKKQLTGRFRDADEPACCTVFCGLKFAGKLQLYISALYDFRTRNMCHCDSYHAKITDYFDKLLS